MPAPAQTAADATLGKLTLRVRGPGGTTQTVALASGCCRIGSGDGCTLRLRAPGIRQVHCVIFRGPQRTVVRGLAKETWLNGAVFFESPLKPGDSLRLGRLEIDVLADERLAGEAETTGSDEYPLSADEADGGSPPEGMGSDPLSAESAATMPAEASWLPANTFDQLQQLVAGQTAEVASFAADALEKVRGVEDRLGARLSKLEEQSRQLEQAMNDIRALRSAWEDEGRKTRAENQEAANFAAEAREQVRGVEDRLAEQLSKLEEQSRQLEHAMNDIRALRSAREDEGRKSRAEQQEAASFAADALEKVRGVEGRLGARLDKVEDQSRQLKQALNDLRALPSAWEDEGRKWRAEHQEAEAAWRQSLGDLDRRVKELAAAPVVPVAGASGNEPAADWRQFDDRLAVLERLVGQEDQQHAKRSQELEGVVARLAQVEATVARNEASGQAVESRLTQVERLEIQLAELACQQATSGQLGTSLQKAWDEWRGQWPQQWTRLSGAVDDLHQQTRTLVEEFRRHERDHSAACDELQRRCTSLETELSAARSHESVRGARTDLAESPSSPFEAVDRRHSPDRGSLDDPQREAAGETGSPASEEPQPEELSFEQVSKEAPLSTLDVLRRMGASVDFSDDEESPALPPRAPARPAPAPPAAEGPKSSAGAGQAEHQGGQHEDGGAIDHYMSQLLERMRSPNARTAQHASAPPAAESPAPRPSPSASERITPAAQPSTARTSQFVPRATAPELAADFSAMRALANNTARHALDTHRRHGQVRSTRGKLLVAGVALTISFALLWLSSEGSRLALWSAIGSLLISTYWATRYVLLTRRLRGKTKADVREDSEPASQEPSAAEQAVTQQPPT